MGRMIKVTSIDVVERFAAALNCFGEDAKTSLEAVEMEIRKALHWIQREQRDYWTQRVRRGWDEVNIARKELERKMMFYAGDERPSCHDERLALEAAKRRLQRAQEKIEACKRWGQRAEREVNEYVGAVAQLKRWMEHDLPRAQADLARMARALEDYVALESSDESALPPDLAAMIGSQSDSETQDGEESTEAAGQDDSGSQPPSGEEEQTNG